MSCEQRTPIPDIQRLRYLTRAHNALLIRSCSLVYVVDCYNFVRYYFGLLPAFIDVQSRTLEITAPKLEIECCKEFWSSKFVTDVPILRLDGVPRSTSLLSPMKQISPMQTPPGNPILQSRTASKLPPSSYLATVCVRKSHKVWLFSRSLRQ
jgi:hypothetical protein